MVLYIPFGVASSSFRGVEDIQADAVQVSGTHDRSDAILPQGGNGFVLCGMWYFVYLLLFLEALAMFFSRRVQDASLRSQLFGAPCDFAYRPPNSVPAIIPCLVCTVSASGTCHHLSIETHQMCRLLARFLAHCIICVSAAKFLERPLFERTT